MGNRKDCERLMQEIATKREAFCARPGCNSPSQCGHHVFGRARLATAFLPEGIIGLCAKDHGWAHARPNEFKKFMIDRLGEDRYYELRHLSYTHVDHPDYTEIREELRRVLADIREVNLPF